MSENLPGLAGYINEVVVDVSRAVTYPQAKQ